jgi:hypothetical protein
MDKKFAAAAGATVTSAAFQLSTVVWPDWIKHHTGVVWALWIAACCLWLWWGIAHLIAARSAGAKPVERHTESSNKGVGVAGDVSGSILDSSSKNSGNQVGRDNTGRMISHVEHYHEAEKDKPYPVQTQPTVALGFAIRPRVTHIVYEQSPGCWKERPKDYKEAKRALVIDVMRDVPPPGPQAKHSVSVLAILRFTSIGTEQIPRAYWLDQQDYRASFIVGHKESLVVGTYEDPYLASYTNPRFGELMEDQFPILPVRQLGQRTIMPAIPFTLEISLWDWYANSTIQQNKVAVEFQEKRFFITWFS